MSGSHPYPKLGHEEAARRIGTRFGELELLARIGEGGMGAVYVARPARGTIVERLYALKIPHPWVVESVEGGPMLLVDEARIAGGIRHPNVIPVLGLPVNERGEMALLMDYVEGASFDWITKRARLLEVALPVPVLLRVLLDGLAGLSAAHRQQTIDGRPMQVVHRDIAPNNLFVGVDGHTRLTDFGIAAAVERYTETRVGSVKGRLAYMAPERIAGRPADARSDVFSYGVMIWETLAGARLFRGSNDYNTAKKVLDLVVPSLAALDARHADFDPVIASALARCPDDRFDCADELLEALEETALTTVGIATSRMVERTLAPLLRARIETQRRAIEAAAAPQSFDVLSMSELGITLDDPTIVDVVGFGALDPGI